MEKHGEMTPSFSIPLDPFPSNVFQRKMVEMQSVFEVNEQKKHSK